MVTEYNLNVIRQLREKKEAEMKKAASAPLVEEKEESFEVPAPEHKEEVSKKTDAEKLKKKKA